MTYDIGFKKPPIANRFKKGVSGNPKGRPKKASSSLPARVDAVLREKVRVTISGQQRFLTRQEMIVRGLIKQALEGKISAIYELLRLRNETAKHGLPAPRVIIEK